MNGHPESDGQRQQRTNMFVMATLYADSGSGPVKVRNLSSGGALIEGGAIPPPETRVRLCRGALQIMGGIVWRKGERAGLQFESNISVADWLPRGRALDPQQLVDEMVQHAKASQTGVSQPLDDRPISRTNKISAIELTRLRRALETLAEDLASDPNVLKRHALKLQVLDTTAQLLRKLASERCP